MHPLINPDRHLPWVHEFDNLHYEWRRLFAEAAGTFLLVIAAVGAPVANVASHGQVPLDAQVVAPGLMVIGIIYAMGMVSGAHLNPAVSCAFALRGNFPWKRVPGYVAAQLAGAIAAVELLKGLVVRVGILGATYPAPGVSGLRTLAIEGVITFGLVTVILGTAAGARNVGTNGALAIGFYIVLAGLWAAPLTGASMNPARTIAPDLISGNWDAWWAYAAGQLAGAAAAVGCAWVLRGPPSFAASLAAQGEPEE